MAEKKTPWYGLLVDNLKKSVSTPDPSKAQTAQKSDWQIDKKKAEDFSRGARQSGSLFGNKKSPL
jgi:hypothetical protein